MRLFISAVLTILAMSAATPATAQYAEGRKWLGAHLGVSGYGSAPAVGISGEVGYHERWALGGWLDTWSYGQTFANRFGGSSWSVRYIALAGTGSYHFLVKSDQRWDPFLGAALGYYIVSTEARDATGFAYGGDTSRLFLSLFGGARYFFNEKVAGVARLGFGGASLTLGVDFRM
jgi:hypothetical protein